ncbi:biotin/lipoyl-containing protein, partial [Caldovatus aquaticus]
MATNILMPALSPTMTEGNLARWLKKEGDRVKPGDVIAEIETDKATMEVEAADEGILGKILVPDGTQGVKVNQPIAVLVEEGEAVPSGPVEGGATASEPAPAPAAPAAPSAAPGPAPAAPAAAAPAAARGNGHDREQRIVASPLARRMAQQAGLDLSRIAGSGPGGRIVKADIEAALARAAPAAAPPPPAAPAPAAAPAP